MRVEQHIAALLYRYNCVVMPEFGGFLAHSQSARIDGVSNTIHPPTKTISFNEQLSKNDGLLVSHMADIKGISFDEMLEEVLLVSKGWKKQLQQNEILKLEGIGTMRTSTNGRINFQPEDKVNYLVSAFGLSSFTASPLKRETMKETVVTLEERIPLAFTPERRKEASIKPLLKYAAIALLAIATGFTGYQVYHQSLKNQALVQEVAREQVSKYIQQATFFDSAPLELPSIKLSVNKIEKVKKTHTVIAGAFRFKNNADKKIGQLKKKGYNAFYVGTNPFGLHQVAYDSFENSKEALAFLRKIRRTESRDAWLLSKK